MHFHVKRGRAIIYLAKPCVTRNRISNRTSKFLPEGREWVCLLGKYSKIDRDFVSWVGGKSSLPTIRFSYDAQITCRATHRLYKKPWCIKRKPNYKRLVKGYLKYLKKWLCFVMYLRDRKPYIAIVFCKIDDFICDFEVSRGPRQIDRYNSLILRGNGKSYRPSANAEKSGMPVFAISLFEAMEPNFLGWIIIHRHGIHTESGVIVPNFRRCDWVYLSTSLCK